MRNNKGQFEKGFTWREPKPYWNKKWLFEQYVVFGKSSQDIAKEQGCLDTNIQYFLSKFGIKRRSISEARKVKHWGQEGVDNPMWNRKGELNPNYKGGISPERQAFYSSEEWKKGGQKKNTDIPFHIHHIKSFADKELRTDSDNLILLCEPCHWWVHSKENKNHEYIQ